MLYGHVQAPAPGWQMLPSTSRQFLSMLHFKFVRTKIYVYVKFRLFTLVNNVYIYTLRKENQVVRWFWNTWNYFTKIKNKYLFILNIYIICNNFYKLLSFLFLTFGNLSRTKTIVNDYFFFRINWKLFKHVFLISN